jgi:hypothetical protein
MTRIPKTKLSFMIPSLLATVVIYADTFIIKSGHQESYTIPLLIILGISNGFLVYVLSKKNTRNAILSFLLASLTAGIYYGIYVALVLYLTTTSFSGWQF